LTFFFDSACFFLVFFALLGSVHLWRGGGGSSSSYSNYNGSHFDVFLSARGVLCDSDTRARNSGVNSARGGGVGKKNIYFNGNKTNNKMNSQRITTHTADL
jgi:hypothetical protein